MKTKGLLVDGDALVQPDWLCSKGCDPAITELRPSNVTDDLFVRSRRQLVGPLHGFCMAFTHRFAMIVIEYQILMADYGLA